MNPTARPWHVLATLGGAVAAAIVVLAVIPGRGRPATAMHSAQETPVEMEQRPSVARTSATIRAVDGVDGVRSFAPGPGAFGGGPRNDDPSTFDADPSIAPSSSAREGLAVAPAANASESAAPAPIPVPHRTGDVAMAPAANAAVVGVPVATTAPSTSANAAGSAVPGDGGSSVAAPGSSAGAGGLALEGGLAAGGLSTDDAGVGLSDGASGAGGSFAYPPTYGAPAGGGSSAPSGPGAASGDGGLGASTLGGSSIGVGGGGATLSDGASAQIAASVMTAMARGDDPERVWATIGPRTRAGDALIARIDPDDSSAASLLTWAERLRTDAPQVSDVIAMDDPRKLEAFVARGLPASLAAVGFGTPDSYDAPAIASLSLSVRAAGKRFFVATTSAPKTITLADLGARADLIELVIAATDAGRAATEVTTALGALRTAGNPTVFVRLPSSTSALGAASLTRAIVAAAPNVGVSLPYGGDALLTELRP